MAAEQLLVMLYVAILGAMIGVLVFGARLAVRHFWGIPTFGYDPLEDVHQDALDYDAYLSPCVCGAPRTEDHNGFLWRRHHGSTVADADRRPPRPTDGLEKARW